MMMLPFSVFWKIKDSYFRKMWQKMKVKRRHFWRTACRGVIADSAKEVLEYFEEQGIDMEDADEESILEASEVFDIGDGRYLIVEG